MSEFGKLMISGTFGRYTVIPARPRGYFTHVYLPYGIDRVTLSIEKENSGDVLLFEGNPVGGDGTVGPLSLSVGKNTWRMTLKGADGVRKESEINILRAYPTPCWERLLEHAPWCPRDSAGEAVFKERLWILGGYIPTPSGDIWSSADGIDWLRHTDCPTAGGIDIPVVYVYNGKLHVTDLHDTIWATEDGSAWEKVCDDAPWAGGRKSALSGKSHRILGGVFRDKVWLFGAGKEESIWSSSDGGRTWTMEARHVPWCKRDIDATLLVFQDKIWLLGGAQQRPGTYFPFIGYNDVWCSADGLNWERVTREAEWPARMWHSTFVYRNRMWIAGGYRSEPENRHLGDVWYSADGKHWREFRQHASQWINGRTPETIEGSAPLSIPAPVWEDRHESSVLVKDDAVYLMGGMIWPLTNDVWKLKIDGFCFLTQPVFETCAGYLYEYKAFADFAESCQDARYRLYSAPPGFTIEEDTGYLSGSCNEAGRYEIVIEAYTEAGETVQQTYVLDVMAP